MKIIDIVVVESGHKIAISGTIPLSLKERFEKMCQTEGKRGNESFIVCDLKVSFVGHKGAIITLKPPQ